MPVKFFLGSLQTIFSVFVFASCCLSQSAPQPSPAPLDIDDGKDDIFLLVKIEAKELKMDKVPNETVTFPGTEPKATIWTTERRNLPEKLEPGVIYRDIGITLRISSRLENIEQIVREALGEVPLTAAGSPIDSPTLAKAPIETKAAAPPMPRATKTRKSRTRT